MYYTVPTKTLIPRITKPPLPGRHRLVAARLLAACVLFFAQSVLAAQYSIVPLDVLQGGLDSVAIGLNDLGQVAGDSREDRTGNIAHSRAVIWDHGSTPQQLWTEDLFSGIYSGGSAMSINNRGQVAGRAQFTADQGFPLPTPGIPLGRAFFWDAATGLQLLGTLGGGFSQATGINDAGQVAGSAEDPFGIPRAFLWDETHGLQDLGTLGGLYSFANAINESGQVVGYAGTADEKQQAFLWDPVTGMHDLGAGNFSGSRAFGLNSVGQVVGSLLGPGSRAFVWDSQRGIVLLDSSLGHASSAYAINDGGIVVGETSGDHIRACLWDSAGRAFALEDLISPNLGWDRLDVAFDINNSGQIVGYGLFDGDLRGFLMTPVPEPSTIVLAFLTCFLIVAPRFVRGFILNVITTKGGSNHVVAFRKSPQR